MAATTVEQRFWAKVNKTSGCWEWTKSRGSHGYGQFSIDGVPRLAHRVSWRMAFGPVPAGMWVLHHCDNRSCVRPDHLFIGTHTENEHDKLSKGRHYESRKTHCPQGHEYAGDNLAIGTRRDGRKFRQCRACRIRKKEK